MVDVLMSMLLYSKIFIVLSSLFNLLGIYSKA